MGKLKNEIGNVYGDLTVISRAEDKINPSGKHRVYWNCQCSCGNFYTVLGESLRSGRTKSCGQCGRRKRISEQKSDEICKKMIG